MRQLALGLGGAGLFALAIGACGDSFIAFGSDSCTPGQSASCTGPAGCQGTKVCNDDRTFGACDCGSGSGTGGSTSSGGEGGTASSGTGGSTSSGAGGASGSGTGGSASSGTGGGGGTNPANCPTTEPTDGNGCSEQWLHCHYGNVSCACWLDAQLSWSCSECPATQPPGGTSCPDNDHATCPYGDTTCDCTDASVWNCYVCPTTAPTDNTSCQLGMGAHCNYGGTTCVCLWEVWHC